MPGKNPWDMIDEMWADNENVPPAEGGTGGGGWTVIPEGTKVKVVAMDQKYTEVGQKGTPVCKVTFEVVAPTQYAGPHPVKIWHDFWLTIPNVSYLKRDLEILGWQGEKLSILKQGDDGSMIGLGAEVTVGVEKYQDKHDETRTKNVIKFFNATYKHQGVGAEAGATSADDEDIPF